MWILPLIGYLGILFGFGFLTLAIASGLYYLSELVEEHTVLARKILTRLIYTIILLHFLLLTIDRLGPLWLHLLSIASHAVYLLNLRHFPIVRFSDPVFILSCVLVLANHFLWFRHFSTPTYPTSGHYYDYDPYADVPSFTEIAAFFGICVWAVPFALFVSLSAGEMVLPSMGSEYATGDAGATGGVGGGRGGGKKAKGLVKAGIDAVTDWIGETGEAVGLWRGQYGGRRDRRAL